MSSYIRNIFLFNANKEDRVIINGQTVKHRGNDVPKTVSPLIADLRITFCDDFETARAEGVQERLDSLFVDANEVRGKPSQIDYQLYGRSGKIKLDIS